MRTAIPSRTTLKRMGLLIFVLGILFTSGTTLVGVTQGTVEANGNQIGDGHTTGDTIISDQGGTILRVSPNGTTQWQVTTDANTFATVSQGEVFVAYAYAKDESANCGPFASPCGRTGVRMLSLSSEPTQRWTWSYPVRGQYNSELHDFEVLPSGDLVVADMEYESIFIVDPRTGTRRWTWNASNFYKSGPEDPTKRDWLHINDVDQIGPDRFLVSVRNKNQLLIIERDTGVVEVINEGGRPSLINHQHNPHWLGPGVVLVADSENNRIVELHRNNVTGEWTVGWKVNEANDISLKWPRDADRLPNGHTLIADTGNGRVIEVDATGDFVWSYYGVNFPYEADRVGYEEVRPVVPAEKSPLLTSPSRRSIDLSPPLFIVQLYAAVVTESSVESWFGPSHLATGLLGVILNITGIVIYLAGFMPRGLTGEAFEA